MGGGRVALISSLGSGRNFHYFVAQPVEPNWFCTLARKENGVKRSMGSMPIPRVPMSRPSSTPDSMGQLRGSSADFLDARGDLRNDPPDLPHVTGPYRPPNARVKPYNANCRAFVRRSCFRSRPPATPFKSLLRKEEGPCGKMIAARPWWLAGLGLPGLFNPSKPPRRSKRPGNDAEPPGSNYLPADQTICAYVCTGPRSQISDRGFRVLARSLPASLLFGNRGATARPRGRRVSLVPA